MLSICVIPVTNRSLVGLWPVPKRTTQRLWIAPAPIVLPHKCSARHHSCIEVPIYGNAGIVVDPPSLSVTGRSTFVPHAMIAIPNVSNNNNNNNNNNVAAATNHPHSPPFHVPESLVRHIPNDRANRCIGMDRRVTVNKSMLVPLVMDVLRRGRWFPPDPTIYSSTPAVEMAARSGGPTSVPGLTGKWNVARRILRRPTLLVPTAGVPWCNA